MTEKQQQTPQPLMAPEISSNIVEYEFYSKTIHDQIKMIEQYSHIIHQSIEIDKTSLKSYQKLLNSSAFNFSQDLEYGEVFRTLKDIVFEKFSNITQQQQCWKQQYDDLHEVLKKNSEQIKKFQEEYKNLDKDSQSQYQKMNKLKEKLQKVGKDYENNFMHFGCIELNKEPSLQQRQKILAKTQSIQNDHKEFDKNLKLQILSHENSINQQSQLSKIRNKEYTTIHSAIKQQVYKSLQVVNQIDNRVYSESTSKSQQRFTEILDIKSATNDVFEKTKIYNVDQFYQNAQLVNQKQYLKNNQWIPYTTFLTNPVKFIQDPNKNKSFSGQYEDSNLLQIQNKEITSKVDPQDKPYISNEFKDALYAIFKQLLETFGKDQNIPEQIGDITQIKKMYANSVDNRKKQAKLLKTSFQTSEKISSSSQLDAPQITEQEKQKLEKKKLKAKEEEKKLYNPQTEYESLAQYKVYDGKNIKKIEMITNTIFYFTHPQITEEIPDKECKILYKLGTRTLFRSLMVSALQSFRSCNQKLFQNHLQFQNLNKIVTEILNACLETRDTVRTTKVMIMACTLYTYLQDNGNNSQINSKIEEQKQGKEQKEPYYLQELVKTHQIWNHLDLWESMIYTSILEDMQKQFPKGKPEPELNEWMFQYKNLIQSNLLSISVNMIKWNIPKDVTKQIIQKYAGFYGIFDLQLNEIMKYIDQGSSSFGQGPSSLSLLSKYYNQQSQFKTQQQIIQKSMVESKIDRQVRRKGSSDLQTESVIFSFQGSQKKSEGEFEGSKSLNLSHAKEEIPQNQ